MNIVLLTSSRADYGIYRPLIRKMQADNFFNLSLIVFGTHVSSFHGHTIDQIHEDKVRIIYQIESLILGDSPEAIATAMGTTTLKFSGIWQTIHQDVDLMICLGDRYEMLAAVIASAPFNIPIAHFHGGETTLGAIDNKFRHSLTAMSDYHFTSTQKHQERVSQIVGNQKHIYNVGALSLDNLQDLTLLSLTSFKAKYGIDLANPSILITFHPETVSYEKNITYIETLISSLRVLSADYQLIITMPNADTLGNMVRKKLANFALNNPQVFTIESFGVLGYFSCMQHCSFLLGNTSSGIIEAASFKKYVINVGDRQKGRDAGENVLQVPIKQDDILAAVKKIATLPPFDGYNIYGKGNASSKIIDILKNE